MAKKIEVDAKEMEKVSGGYISRAPYIPKRRRKPYFPVIVYARDAESTAVTNTSPNTADNN